MTVYTIGFTKKTARAFFESLRATGARHLLDVRLNNTSQLAGFTKRDDLHYFLKVILNMEYHEVPALAPDKSILTEYRKTRDWAAYERAYLSIIKARHAENSVPSSVLGEGAVLLCSEPEASHCHRRLAAEYLAKLRPSGLRIVHL